MRILKKWDIEKNIRTAEWDEAHRMVQKRKAEGRDETELVIGRKFISSKRVKKRESRPDQAVSRTMGDRATTTTKMTMAATTITARTPPASHIVEEIIPVLPQRIILNTSLRSLPFAQTWLGIRSFSELLSPSSDDAACWF